MGLDHVVVADSFMTTSARYADILLPVNLFVESANFPRMGITSGPTARNFVLLTQKVINPVFDTKLDFEIEVELGNRLGFSSFYQGLTPDTIIQAQLEGGSDTFSQQALSEITLSALVANGGIIRINVLLEGHVPFSKTSPIQTFSTPTGLIEMTVGESCTLCEGCTKTCPHDSLKIMSGELLFDSSTCTACGNCVFVCPENSIALSTMRTFSPTGQKVVYKDEIVPCASCGKPLDSLKLMKKIAALVGSTARIASKSLSTNPCLKRTPDLQQIKAVMARWLNFEFMTSLQYS